MCAAQQYIFQQNKRVDNLDNVNKYTCAKFKWIFPTVKTLIPFNFHLKDEYM